MILFGFAACVLKLKWRYKLIMPLFVSLPLIVSYNESTTIIIPAFLSKFLSSSLNIGKAYYIYIMLYTVFVPNSINIHAGLNGLEVGQCIIIGSAITLYNTMKLNSIPLSLPNERSLHLISITLIFPFIAASLALFNKNKYPAEVFVGNAYTYFAGMVFVVIGLYGHYSKAVLLFIVPQILNFILSFPQLIGVIKCPKHRLPALNSGTLKLECVHHHFTLINAFLRIFGPTNEKQTVTMLLLFQALCCSLGLLYLYAS